jgi:transposase-like protein
LRFTLSFRDVEDLLAERGITVSYETVRRWVNRFGPTIAAELRKRRPRPHTIWHLDEVYLKIDGRMAYLRCIAASMSPVAVPFRAGRKSRPEPSNNLQAAATSQPVHQDNVSEPLTPGEASGRI